MAKAKTEGFLQPHASRADETTEQTTIALTERKNNTKKSGPCKICGTVLSRRADLTRHYKYSHLRERPFGCHLCPNRYAQSGSLKNHIDRHFSIKRYMCDMALEKGGFCNKRFNDGSSLARHRREQHKGVTHECPFPECFDRFNKHTRIKRAACFRGHLRKMHNLTVSSLEEFQVPDSEVVDFFDGPPAPPTHSVMDSPAPSYHELPDTDLPPPPPYNETAYTGEIPIICTPDDDGDASTPGLSFAPSPSPSPSVPDLAWDVSVEKHSFSSSYAPLDPGPIDVEYGTGFPLEKSISEYDMNASFGMGLMHSDIALYNSQSTYDTDGFDALAYSNMLYQNSLAEPYALSEMSTYDAFSQTPYVDACYTEFFSTPENVEKEYFPQYSAWDFPVPEQTFVGQTSTIIPPSLPQFTSSYGVYAS